MTVLDWGLNPGPPALEASTIPLGYRGGGTCFNNSTNVLESVILQYRLKINEREMQLNSSCLDGLNGTKISCSKLSSKSYGVLLKWQAHFICHIFVILHTFLICLSCYMAYHVIWHSLLYGIHLWCSIRFIYIMECCLHKT